MSGKGNAVAKTTTAICETLAVKSKNENSDNSAAQQKQSSSNKQLSKYSNEVRSIEVTVKTKGRKVSGSTNSGTSSDKAVDAETRGRSRANSESKKSWSQTVREENLPAMRQGLRLSAQEARNHKAARRNSVSQERRTDRIAARRASQKYNFHDDVPVRENPLRKKPHQSPKTTATSAIPSVASVLSSVGSVEVVDVGIQCAGTFNETNDRPNGGFDAATRPGFLKKESETLAGDRGKQGFVDLEQATLHAKLDATTAKLASTGRKLEAVCASLREEKEILMRRVDKQTALLEESRESEANLQATLKQVRSELNAALRSVVEKERIIADIEEDRNKRIQIAQRTTTDLRRQLNEQIEIAEERFFETQYLKLEKEKFVALSEYKDSKLAELYAALKDLQNHIAHELMDARRIGRRNDDEASVIRGGIACSSPTPTTSSNDPPTITLSGNNLSNSSSSTVVTSTVERFSNSATRTDARELPVSRSENSLGPSERPAEKTGLEFVSLPAGETSLGISATSHLNEDPACLDDKIESQTKVRSEALHNAPRNPGGGEGGRSRLPSNSQRPPSLNNEIQREDREEIERSQAAHRLDDPASVQKQVELMFQDSRLRTKFPVGLLPSPPRNHLNSDWSDSSLPNISGISESNVV